MQRTHSQFAGRIAVIEPGYKEKHPRYTLTEAQWQRKSGVPLEERKLFRAGEPFSPRLVFGKKWCYSNQVDASDWGCPPGAKFKSSSRNGNFRTFAWPACQQRLEGAELADLPVCQQEPRGTA